MPATGLRGGQWTREIGRLKSESLPVYSGHIVTVYAATATVYVWVTTVYAVWGMWHGARGTGHGSVGCVWADYVFREPV